MNTSCQARPSTVSGRMAHASTDRIALQQSHLLEYIAMLSDEPRPDCGVVSWRTRELMQRPRSGSSLSPQHG